MEKFWEWEGNYFSNSTFLRQRRVFEHKFTTVRQTKETFNPYLSPWLPDSGLQRQTVNRNITSEPFNIKRVKGKENTILKAREDL
jgi:hypothetical protein